MCFAIAPYNQNPGFFNLPKEDVRCELQPIEESERTVRVEVVAQRMSVYFFIIFFVFSLRRGSDNEVVNSLSFGDVDFVRKRHKQN